MRVYLEYLGDSVELPLGETIIGRDVGCALRFNDASVSRRHLKFVHRENEVFVEDLGSANGTLVNGRRLDGSIRLLDSDLLSIGTRDLAIRIPEVDDEEPTTLNLSSMSITDELAARTTSKVMVTVPPPLANQRCPRCGAAVSAEDDECAGCHYRWDTFRPQATTLVGGNPIAPLNRRRHERHNLELHLVYVSADLEVEAVTRDLSASGVFVCSQVLEPLGTPCELTLLVDGGPPLLIRGVVRRVVEHEDQDDAGDPVGLGIEFVEFGAHAKAWLEAVIARQA